MVAARVQRVTTVSRSAMHDSIVMRESGNAAVKACMKPDQAALSRGSFAPDRYARKAAPRRALSVLDSSERSAGGFQGSPHQGLALRENGKPHPLSCFDRACVVWRPFLLLELRRAGHLPLRPADTLDVYREVFPSQAAWGNLGPLRIASVRPHAAGVHATARPNCENGYNTPMTVVETAEFLRKTKLLFSRSERAELAAFVAANPDAGEIIPGTGGVRKIRLPRRGRRGSVRVLYYYHSECLPVFLLSFAKRRKEDLSKIELYAMKRLVSALAAGYPRKG